MRSGILTILKKELTRFFRDRRMVLTTIFLPGILIYVVYTFMGSAITAQYGVEESYVPSISVSGLPESIEAVGTAAGLRFTSVEPGGEEAAMEQVKDGDLDLYVVFPTDFDQAVAAYDPTASAAAPQVALYYNSAESKSQEAYATMLGLLDSYESTLANRFDVNGDQSIRYDLASDADLTGSIFSSLLPLLLLIFLFSGCMAVAPESIAGEKERGTIATLLITPIRRGDIAIGKIVALSIIALLSGAGSTIGTILSLPSLMGEAGNMDGSVYGVTDYALLGVVILSTVLLLVALISIISAFAKNTKEAQSYVVPLMILVMLVGVTAMFGSGPAGDLFYYLIPVYNSVQCMVGIFSFQLNATFVLVTILSNLVYTGLGVFILTRMFNSERIIFAR